MEVLEHTVTTRHKKGLMVESLCMKSVGSSELTVLQMDILEGSVLTPQERTIIKASFLAVPNGEACSGDPRNMLSARFINKTTTSIQSSSTMKTSTKYKTCLLG